MTKKKISSTSPWVYGKGKDLTQSIGTGKNASVLSDFLNQVPKNNSASYPSEIFQDALSQRNYNSAKPAQAVISDMLPVKYQEPVTYSKPSYPVNQVVDDGLSVGAYNKPNFVMMGEQKLLPPPSATQAAPRFVDDVVKPLAKKGISLGAKLAAGATAALPGITDIILPEYANAGESGFDMRNEFAKRDQHKIASDSELARMLGINAPDNFMMPVPPNPYEQQTPSRGVASIEPPQVVDESQAEPSQPSISPSTNPVNTQSADQQSSGGNKNSSYEDILRQQMAALSSQAADRSTMSYLDLSPLMQAVDNMTGSKMAQSYKGPKASAENDMARVSGLSEKLADEAARKKQLDIQMQNALKNTADQRLNNAMTLAAFKDSLKGNGLSEKNVSDYKVNFLKDDRTKDIDALNDFNGELQDYLKEIQTVGNSWETLSSDKRANIESAYNKLVTTVNRDYAKLGALAGADLDILKKIFPEMTGFGGAINRFKGANITNQITNIKDYQSKSKNRAMKQFEKITTAYPKEAIGDGLYNLYYNQLSNMQDGKGAVGGRSPTTPVSNTIKNNDLELRVKAALERARANKAQ